MPPFSSARELLLLLLLLLLASGRPSAVNGGATTRRSGRTARPDPENASAGQNLRLFFSFILDAAEKLRRAAASAAGVAVAAAAAFALAAAAAAFATGPEPPVAVVTVAQVLAAFKNDMFRLVLRAGAGSGEPGQSTAVAPPKTQQVW